MGEPRVRKAFLLLLLSILAEMQKGRFDKFDCIKSKKKKKTSVEQKLLALTWGERFAAPVNGKDCPAEPGRAPKVSRAKEAGGVPAESTTKTAGSQRPTFVLGRQTVPCIRCHGLTPNKAQGVRRPGTLFLLC